MDLHYSVPTRAHALKAEFRCQQGRFVTTRRCANAVYAVVVCPSVRPSQADTVLKQLGSRKQRRTIPRDSSLMVRKNIHYIPIGSPPPVGAPNVGGVGKNCFFDRSRSIRLRRLTAESLCPSATVVQGMCGVINNVGRRGSLFSVMCMYHGASIGVGGFC